MRTRKSGDRHVNRNDLGDAKGSRSEAEILASPAFPVLQALAEVMQDGFDHPEVYRAIENFAENGAASRELGELIAALRPGQTDEKVLKAFDIIAALLLVFRGDKTAGLTFLRSMQHAHKTCIQVAGALFVAERFGTDQSSDLRGRFCSAPFERFETLVDGTVAPCCSLRTPLRLGNLERDSLDEIWNGKSAQAMRESVWDGSFRFCNKQLCPLILEDRLPQREQVAKDRRQSLVEGRLTKLDFLPTMLLLAHDPTCNLACPSCRDRVVVADDNQKKRWDIVERQVFQPLLAQVSEQSVSVHISGQGDPWSSPHYRSLLRTIADGDFNLVLHLHTNALLMSEAKWKEYEGLEKYRLTVDVSIDACTPWVYEVLRRPGKWERLDENLRFIGRLHERGVFEEYQINATIQVDNYHQMGDLFSYAQEVGASKVRLAMIQNTGHHLNADFTEKNIANEAHPLHSAFLECLRDSRLSAQQGELYDVGVWRRKSASTSLPSDELDPENFHAELQRALERALTAEEHRRVVALCAAAQLRDLTTPELLLCEASSLDALGFGRLATYRRQHAVSLGALPASLAGQGPTDRRRHLPLVS